MIPMPPFDGGRIIGALWPPLWFAGFALFVAFAAFMHIPMLFVAIIGLLGLPAMIAAWKGRVDPRAERMTFNARVRVSLWYLATVLGLFFIMAQSHAGAAASATGNVQLVTHRALLVLAGVFIAVALLTARPHPTPGPFLRDFEAYWAAGVAWNAGDDPYGPAIWRAERAVPGVDILRNEALPFVGPPATLLVWGLFARLPYALAATIWASFLGASALALVVATLRGSGALLAPFAFFSLLALALAFGPITSNLALGQLALPAFLGAVLVSRLGPRSLAGTTASACLAFTQPNASLGLVSQFGRNRTTLAFAVAAPIVTYLLGALAAGWAWPVSYARVLSAAPGGRRTFGDSVHAGGHRSCLRRVAARSDDRKHTLHSSRDRRVRSSFR